MTTTNVDGALELLEAASEQALLIAKAFGAPPDVAKAFGAPADAMAGGQTVTIRPDDRQDAPDTGGPTPTAQLGLDRRLACTNCGCSFTVTEGDAALTRKRARQAGLTGTADVRGALKNLNRANGHDRQNRLS